jgi:hypothetical protein
MNQHPKEEASLIADALIFSGQFSCGRQKPAFLNEYIELFGIETTSENGWGRKPILKPINNNTLIGTLAENKHRMEQEAILLDKRFESTLSEHLSIHLEQTAKSR